MVKIYEPDQEEIAEYEGWIESRPEPIKSIAKRFRPWILYTLRDTNQNVTIYSFSENGTVTIDVGAKYNDQLLFEKRVFNINPNDLKECESMPNISNPVPVLTSEEVDTNIDIIRCFIRPDLFKMNDHGKAERINK